MSVGTVHADQMISATAEGSGNPVYIVGSSTGRDGIHGATFASEEISEESEEKRPSVQVGDPFTEKLLLEATLELVQETDAAVGVQDMGAAGITSSSFEMSERGGVGMVIHADRVPMREEGMTPYEIMLSESQERMLVVCEKGREDELEAVYEKWDLHAVQIGEVVEGDHVDVYWHGERVCHLPVDHTAGDAVPVYDREAERPDYLDETTAFDAGDIPDVTAQNATETLLELLDSPNIASKRWVYEQYDTMVRTNTVVGPGASDAAVVRVKGTDRGLSVKTDCNGRYVYLNPRRGGQIAVAEAARNVVCSGGRPVAITNCLNFGNPYKPEVFWVFREAVGGMGDACRVLNTPVTGGNVSFYNEHPEGAVFPTPTVGMLGVVEDIEKHPTTTEFQAADDEIFLLHPEPWTHRDELGASEYLATVHGQATGDAPHLDLEEESAVQSAMLELIQSGLVRSAHDVSDGGLAVTLAESVLQSEGLGASVQIDAEGIRLDALLFGEAQSRIVFSVHPEDRLMVEMLLEDHPVEATAIGMVTEATGLSLHVGEEPVIAASNERLSAVYENAIPSRMSME
jgi:phosphoribosylformylglycinamidine synthase